MRVSLTAAGRRALERKRARSTRRARVSPPASTAQSAPGGRACCGRLADGDRGASCEPEPARQHYNLTLAVLASARSPTRCCRRWSRRRCRRSRRTSAPSTTAVTWVLTVYLLTASVATPILGRLGDMFGKERMLLLVLVVFALGSLVWRALALDRAADRRPRDPGRAGAVFPLAFGIIRDEFPREQVATGIGLISATFGIGGGAGLVLSGVIVDNLSYEWIFWLGLVVIVIAIVATHFFVPESPVKTPGQDRLGGAALLSGGARLRCCSASARATTGAGARARARPVRRGRRSLLVPGCLRAARARSRWSTCGMMRLRGVWTTNLTGLLLGFGMFGSFILIPQFVQMPDEHRLRLRRHGHRGRAVPAARRRW